ncbi:hypothetical protein [Nonomuraea cavernae]|uniref:hypothetical protein n=1 Tax=Nonomuraea cavernae TaxID=2045107 RepID=UPI0033D28D64
MRMIGTLLVALAVTAAACAPSNGGKATTPTHPSDAPTVSAPEETPEGDDPEETPTPGPVAMPTGDGAGWRYAYISKQRKTELTDVTVAGPKEAWAVGSSGTKLLLLRYDGRRWREVDPPAELNGVLPPTYPPASDEGLLPGEESPPNAEPTWGDVHVAASAPDNVWLLVPKGPLPADGNYFAFRWNGSRWLKMPTMHHTAHVADFKVFGPDDAWTLHGYYKPDAMHWNGRSWRRTRLPADAHSLSGTGPEDVWAVGARDSGPAVTGAELNQPATMHWNGRSWRLIPTPTYAFAEPKPPEGSAVLSSVVALARDNVWAAGSHSYNHGEGRDLPVDPPPILLHWDGERWTKHTAPGCCGTDLAADGSGGILLSTPGTYPFHTSRLSPTGQWGDVPRPPAAPNFQYLRDIDVKALASAPRNGSAWAVGRLFNRKSQRAVIIGYG